MAANIYLYGYGEDATPLVSCKQQKQMEQDGVDKAQDARMDKIDEVNKQQTEKLTENDGIHQTIVKLKELYYSLKNYDLMGAPGNNMTYEAWFKLRDTAKE